MEEETKDASSAMLTMSQRSDSIASRRRARSFEKPVSTLTCAASEGNGDRVHNERYACEAMVIPGKGKDRFRHEDMFNRENALGDHWL